MSLTKLLQRQGTHLRPNPARVVVRQFKPCLASIPKVIRRRGDEVDLAFSTHEDISERVIFPVTESQSNGIEDARFVAFDTGTETVFNVHRIQR